MLAVMQGPKQLETWRTGQKMTRRVLADQLGIHELTVFRWERGIRRPGQSLMERIRDLAGVPVESWFNAPRGRKRRAA